MLNSRISNAGSTHELLNLASANSEILNHIHAATLWNKLGKQGDAAGPRYKGEVRWLLRRTLELVDSCTGRALSNIAHGLAKCRLVGLDGEADALFAAVAEEAVRVGLGSFDPQNLANLAWAYAKAGHHTAPALLDAIAAAAVRGGLRDFNPQHLVNTTWAFAKAGRAAPTLFDAIATAAVRRGLRDFTPQELANTSWAFATAGHAAPTFFDAIATEAVRGGLRDFSPQDLANVAWAFAKVGHVAPTLLDAIATDTVRGGLRDFKPQELCMTAWAFATAGHAAPVLLDAIATEAVRRGLRDFNPQDRANTAWAFAVADHPAPALLDSDAFVQQLWAAERSFATDDLRQLHQWQLWREERGADWPPLPPELAQRCLDAFTSEDGVPSRLQRDVVASLQALGLTPREEVRTEQGYSLDAVVLYGGREVAIEIDGPSHFCGRTPTGATALKRRQLRAVGWVLLPVPYWEWDGLSNNSARQEYLRAALRQHVLPAGDA